MLYPWLRRPGPRLVALHVIEKTDDSDFFMSSVAVLEGSPFPVNEFPAIPVDVLLQERSLDLWNFIGRTVEANNQVKITKRLRMGSLVKEIAAIDSRKIDIDLIVLELRKRFLFPDLATLRLLRFIRRLDCPVLIGSPLAQDRREPGKALALIQPDPKKPLHRETVILLEDSGDPRSRLLSPPRPKPDRQIDRNS